jgi:hypothetical protein
VLAGLSFALDLKEGRRAGHSVRSCAIDMRLAEVIGLSRDQRVVVRAPDDLGCSSNASVGQGSPARAGRAEARGPPPSSSVNPAAGDLFEPGIYPDSCAVDPYIRIAEHAGLPRFEKNCASVRLDIHSLGRHQVHPSEAGSHSSSVSVNCVLRRQQPMRKWLLMSAVIALGLLAAPSVVFAQSAIAGVIRDATGAVLPGVTVEASSPALIEKVKTATSNEAGQYRVVDLRPGVYKVTFALTGFSTVVREGVLLESNFTAPINVEMKVGTVEENVTVTGESPIVDVQTSQRREVVSQTLLDALPTGRNFQLMAGTVPSVTTGVFDVGGSSSMWTGGSLLTHGSLTFDSRTLIDGMVVDAMFGGGQCSCVYDNENQTQEMAVQVSGGAAENELSGVLVNRIPKTGGKHVRRRRPVPVRQQQPPGPELRR